MPTIAIVEDKRDDYLLLCDLLKEAFPGYTVVPHESVATPTFADWSSVAGFVEGISDDDVILCMDLALQDTDYYDVLRGVEKGNRIRLMRPGWTLVAYTRWGVRAKLVPDYDKSFHGMIEKAAIDPLRRDQRIDYVRRIVAMAVAKRSELLFPKGGVRVVDSLGMRLFSAAFGDSGLSEIVANEAGGWASVTVKALSSGHSGAFMLLLSAAEAGRKAVILKVARSEATITHEIEAQTRFLRELGPLNGLLASLNPEKVPLTDSGVYYRQAHVDGSSLLETALFEPNSVKPVRAIVKHCLDVYKVDLTTCDLSTADRVYRLNPLDLGRFDTSVTFLSQLARALVREGLWPASIPGPEIVMGAVHARVREWEAWNVLKTELRMIVQHGDLNPGNVMLRPDGRIVLIDLARLGRWPVGYDLSRLALMLRLRLVDSADSSEFFPSRLSIWLEESVANLEGQVPAPHQCPMALHCDNQYAEFLGGAPEAERTALRLGYMLGSLWDLVKIASYQDIAVFKRLWAVIESWRLIERISREP